MFGGRRPSGIVEEDDEEISEATMVFSAQNAKIFDKHFPKKQADVKSTSKPPLSSSRLSILGLPALTPVPKLNLDDTIPLHHNFLNSQLIESKNTIEALENQLQKANAETRKYQEKKEELDSVVISQQAEIQSLKEKIIRQEYEYKEDLAERDAKFSKVLMEEWKSVASKYYMWYQYALAQLAASKEIIQEAKAWNKTNKGLILDSIREVRFDLLRDEDMEELSSGSIQDFEGMTGLEDEETHADEASTMHKAEEESRTLEMLHSGESSSADSDGSKTGFRRPLSPILSSQDAANVIDETQNESSANESSFLNSCLLNTTYESERNELIERLELENANMRDKLNITRDRVQKSLMYQEQVRHLELKCSQLEMQVERMVKELAHLRSATAKGIFGMDALGPDLDKAAVMMDRIIAMEKREHELVTEMKGVKSIVDDLRNTVDYLTTELTNARVELQDQKQTNHELKNELDETTNGLNSVEERLRAALAEKELMKAQLAAAAASQSTLEKQETDAGDSTQIIHMKYNPLQEAHDRMMEEEEQEKIRKRKAEDNPSSSGDDQWNSAKRVKDEQIEYLEQQLIRSEKEKETALRVQSEYARKYRELTTNLTGWQIKMKNADEGLCTVNNVYDDSKNEFVFRLTWETGCIDLLDYNQDSQSQGSVWSDEMKRYIGERKSIPAFLAAVNLDLESRREVEESDERTHTYSVLHED